MKPNHRDAVPISLRVVAGYFIFGVLWILLSDNALLFFVPHFSERYVLIQSLKGWLFVSLSALLIHAILKTSLRALKEREERITYQAGLLEKVSDALISTDADFKVVSWNPAAERIYGWTEKEALGKSLRGILQTEFRGDSFENVMAQVMEKGGWSGEVNQFRKDGKRLIIWSSVSIVRDEGGAPTAFIGVNRDISSRVFTEQVLRESQEIYRELFENNPQPMWVYDLETHAFLMVNDAAVAHYGYTREEFMGMTIRDIRPAEDVAALLENLAQPPRDMQKTSGWRHRKKDGALIDVEISSHALLFNGRPARMVLANDITERKRAEEALKLSENRFHSALDGMLEGVQILDFDWRYIYLNRSAEEHNRRPNTDLLGRRYMEMWPGIENTHVFAVIKRCLEERVSFQLENEFAYSDGTIRWFNLSIQPVSDGVLIHSVDITERKMAEESLRGSEARFRAMFEDMPIAVWEQDFSAVKKYLDSLKAGGVADLRAHFAEHPEELLRCENMIRVLDVNQAAVRMYEAKNKQELISATMWETSAGELANGVEEMIAIAGGRAGHFWEGRDETMTGRPIEISVNWSVSPGYEQDYSRIIVTTMDITERRQAEIARGRLSDVLEASLNEIYIFDPVSLGFEYVNSGARLNLGYSLEELKTMTPVDLKPQFTEASFRNVIAPLLSGGKSSLNFETLHRRADGSLYPVEVHLQLVETGNERSYLAVISDITERKQAERALTERLTELELLYQSGLALGGELEPKQVAEKLIEALETKMDWHHIAIRKYDPESDRLTVLAYKFPSLENGAQKQSVEERFNAAVSNSGQGLSGWAARHGETVRSGDVQADERYIETYPEIKSGLYAPMTLGGRVVGVISVESRQPNAFGESDERLLKTIANQAAVAFENAKLFQNLQGELLERRLTEEALRISEEQMRLTLQTTSDGFWIVDSQGGLLEANSAYCEMSGYSREELLQMRIPDLEALENEGETRERISLVKQEGHERFESRHRRKDGSEFDVELTVNLLDENAGLFICFCRDITERKRAEGEILQRTQDLALVNTLNEAANRGESVEAVINLFTQEAYGMFDCRDAAVYLISMDGNYLEMQSNSISGDLMRQIEDFIGFSIPKIRLPIQEGSHTQYLLSHTEGFMTDNPEDIQKWISEFAETTFLPNVLRAPVRAIVPRIFGMLNIRSAIAIPLVSSGRTIGLMDFSSVKRFNREDLQRLLPISRQITAILLRKQFESSLAVQLKRIIALNDIDRAIGSGLDMRLSLEVLLKEVVSQLKVDAADVLLMNPVNQALEYVTGKGFNTSAVRQSRLMLGQGLAGRVGLEQKVAHVPDLKTAANDFTRSSLLKGEGFVEYFGVPLIAKGSLKGVLEIFNRAPLTPDPDWLNYLETLGGQAAIAIDNAQLFEGLQRSNQEMMAAYDATIAGWSHAMDLRDKETEGHTRRVTELTVRLARQMGVSQHEQIHIRRGALLHDIGKLGVPDHILLKPGKLTDEEWEIMRRHPAYAHEMLLPITYLEPALDIPYCHHEKWDGSGYPRGLKGGQIPLPARIFAVVDVWDALRSDRPYRRGWSVEKVRAYILAESGKHFDPQVVEAFIRMMDESSEMQ
ncbi:MAG: PAS domain S-box protein [Anaerolineales bacterium]|nr:PAS domain S-box protein [Anaerolineales bacterium]